MEAHDGFSTRAKSDNMDIHDLLRFMVARKASDMHLKAMRPPLLRIEKKLTAGGEQPLEPDQIRDMLLPMLTEKQRLQLEEKLWVDLGYSVPGVSRFRVSITHQRGSLAAAFRRIPFEFPSLDEWGLPPVIEDFAKLEAGLVLITGPTGNGKSSTLAALLRLVCTTRPVHIVTIEDPIEFLITDSLGVISQREVGTDTLSFADALRNVVRQDPDVIAVGEMRDLETTSTAITAAETGHLVFSTLHTNSASQTIDRIIDAFPARQHAQVRAQLSQVLQGIISLKLVSRGTEPGLTAAVEILRMTPRIAKLIEEGNIVDIETEMEKSVSFFKMQTMNQSLMALVLNGEVTQGTAQAASLKSDDFERDMRTFLYSESGASSGDADMAESKADFSKIVELQEVQHLYDECQERHRTELADKDRIISQLQDEIQEKDARLGQASQSTSGADKAVEQARNETASVKKDLEAKIAKLQARVKELSAAQKPDPASSGTRRGFFSR
ncbi:MAG: PilT/PilU family type 4a pilus ATPase [Acidobacteriota bacterium]